MKNIKTVCKKLPEFLKNHIVFLLTILAIGRFGWCLVLDYFDPTNKAAILIGKTFLFLLLLFMTYIYIRRANIKERLHKVYFVMGIAIGVMFMIIIPIFCAPDEIFHFKDAYHVSNVILGIHDPDEETLTMRLCDTQLDFNKISYENPIEYAKYIRSIFSGIISHQNDLIVTDYGKNYGADYLYFIPAAGMAIARLIHLGNIQMFLMGRFFNLVFFVLCMAYAIKKTPIAKVGFFGVGLLPIIMQQAASMSYDVMINAFSIVVTALSLLILDEEKKGSITIRDYVIYALTLGLLIPTKGHAYMLFFLFPLYAVFKQRRRTGVWDKKLLASVSGIIGINIVVTVIQKLFGTSGPATSLFEPHYIEWCNEDGYYVRMLFEKPDIRFQVFYKTIATYFDEYWAGAFGNALGWQNIEVPPVLIYSWFLLMAVLFMKRKQEKTLLYTGDKLVVFGAASMTIAFILAGMLFGWTPRVYNYVVGAQGRYFVPILPLMMLLTRTDKIEIDEKYDGWLCFWSLALTTLIILFVYVNF